MPGAIVREGEVRDVPVVDLLAAAVEAGRPVVLELERGNTLRRLWFRDGAIVAMTTSNPAEGLPTMLVRRRMLPQASADAVEAVAARDGITPAMAVLRDRLLPAPQLAAELDRWARALLAQALTWDRGQFRLRGEGNELPPETLLELAPLPLAVDAIRQRVDRGTVASWLGADLGKRVEAGALALDGLGLTDADREAVGRLLASASLEAFIASSPSGEESAGRLAAALLRVGALRAVDAKDDDPLSGLDDDPFAGLDAFQDAPRPAPDQADDFDESTEPTRPGASDEVDDLLAQLPDVSPPPPPTGVDLQSLRFGASRGAARRSSTYHADVVGKRERVEGVERATRIAERATGSHRTVEPAPISTPPSSTRLRAAEPARTVAPPRAGGAGWKHGQLTTGSMRAVPPDPASPLAPRVEASPDDPPVGPGPVVEREDWARLSTTEKDRVRALKSQLADMERQNYFEWLGLTYEATEPLIKKAWFKAARRFHPDSLHDEGPVYRELAEALFARLSEAYEVISEEDAREKYVAKVIRGEKDENDLAMERVQQVLEAEGEFKAGLRLLNAGKLMPAVERFRAAHAGYPEEAEYLGYLGFALARRYFQSDREQAYEGERMLERAISMMTNNAKLSHLLGKLKLQRSDWDGAKKYLRMSLKLQPDNAEAVREYKRADDMQKGPADDESGIKSLFGRLKK